MDFITPLFVIYISKHHHQGNYVQELLLDEAVRIADALSRSIVSSGRKFPLRDIPEI
jgi:hypothetical protein